MTDADVLVVPRASRGDFGQEKPVTLSRNAEAPAQVAVERELHAFSAFWPRSTDAAEARRYAYQCADVLDVWCDTIGKACAIEPLFVSIFSSRGEPLLLLPLGIERRAGLRILTFLDGGVSDFNAPVVFSGARDWDEATVRRAWRDVSEALPPFDLALFGKMPGCVEDWPNPLRFLFTAEGTQGNYGVLLPADWDDAAPRILPNQADSRRRVRKLEKLGKVSFAIARDHEEASAFLGAMMTMKRRKFMEAEGIDMFAVRPGYADYYVEVTKRLFDAGSVHLSALKLDDRILAAHWGYVVGSRFHQLMPAYDADAAWKLFSPGRLLNEFLMEWSVKRGLKTFDFGVGDEPYKAAYTDVHQPLYEAVLPATPKGRAFGWYADIRRFAARRLRDTKLGAAIQTARRKSRRALRRA